MASPYILPAVLRPEGADRAVQMLQLYTAPGAPDGPPPYTGSQFESFGHNDTNRITADDLVAVTMLGVNFPPGASLWILGNGAKKISKHLSRIENIDLFDQAAEPLIARGGDAWELWNLIDARPGVDMTLASKLLARKRPKLIPVQDSVVRAAVGWHAGSDFWASMRDLLLRDDAALVDHLRTLRSRAGLESTHSILRTFDIAVWMSTHDTGKD